MVGILHGAQLAFQKDGLVILQGLVQIGGYIAHIGSCHIPVPVQGLKQGLLVQGLLSVEILQKDVLLHGHPGDLFPENVVVLEKLGDLPADLGVLVRIEGSDAGFGGAEGLAAQSLLFALVEQDVIGHDELAPFGDHDLRGRNASFLDAFQFSEENGNVQGHSVADDVHDILVEDARRKGMKGKFAVLVLNGMARVGTALKADDDIRLVGQRVRDLSFSLVAPVGAYYCFYHLSKFLLYIYCLIH